MSQLDTIVAEETPQAWRLARFLMESYEPQSIIDIGCATGLYLDPFYERGREVRGFDIDPEAVERGPDFVTRADITDPDFHPGPKADLAICLEVFEHIPERDIHVAAASLAKASDLLIFSAAAIGQGGVGHINCQDQEYWRGMLAAHGFIKNTYETGILVRWMQQGPHMGWLTQNVMVLRRNYDSGLKPL